LFYSTAPNKSVDLNENFRHTVEIIHIYKIICLLWQPCPSGLSTFARCHHQSFTIWILDWILDRSLTMSSLIVDLFWKVSKQQL